MTSKNIALFLVLLIGLAPVAEAFAYCSEMDESASVRQLVTDAGTGSMKHVMQGLDGSPTPAGQSDMSCHSGSACLFHLCGMGLTGAARLTMTDQSSHAQRFIQQPLFSTFLLPELRPPIQAL